MVLATRRARNACWLKLGMRDGCWARGMLTVSPGFRPGLLVTRGVPVCHQASGGSRGTPGMQRRPVATSPRSSAEDIPQPVVEGTEREDVDTLKYAHGEKFLISSDDSHAGWASRGAQPGVFLGRFVS